MPNRVLQQKALKLQQQKAVMVLGPYKRHRSNDAMVSKFSPKNARAYVLRDAKPVVPEYDLAMVQKVPMHVAKPRKRK